GGGNGGVSVSTQPECAWDAAADASWISGLAPTSGQGSGQIQFAVAANPDPVARQADIKVNGETARVRQDAAAWRFEIAQHTQSLGAPGGTVNIVVTTTTACSWTASSSVSWIAIASGASATG